MSVAICACQVQSMLGGRGGIGKSADLGISLGKVYRRLKVIWRQPHGFLEPLDCRGKVSRGGEAGS